MEDSQSDPSCRPIISTPAGVWYYQSTDKKRMSDNKYPVTQIAAKHDSFCSFTEKWRRKNYTYIHLTIIKSNTFILGIPLD